MPVRPPVVWSIAGHDTAGGAGLSADQRAADAMGVHLCPVLACVTAQHSQGVDAVFALPPEQLDAQLQALARDLPPKAIKTGLLGSVDAVLAVARWVDHLREGTPPGQDPHRHLALVVDPVLRATAGGVAFSHEALVQAYRTHLLPRATVVTPNRAEARALLGQGDPSHQGPLDDIPDLALALQAQGARAALVTGGDAAVVPHPQPPDLGHSVDWLQAPHASGWLTAERVATTDHHGSGCTLASGIAAALALGHVEADACVLGKMLAHHALMHSRQAGQGAGPVVAQRGFASGWAAGGAPMPCLGLGRALPWALSPGQPLFQPFTAPADGLYGIVATAQAIDHALAAGLRCLQLRHKAAQGLAPELHRSLALAAQAGAQLFINDHWVQALQAAQDASPDQAVPSHRWGLHLGQEDLLALTDAEQQTLLAARHRVMLGLSSHSLWELARATGCGASLIACGPVQATTTKDMPWLPQGLDNLRWWVAQSPVPVVAIGGLLTPDDIHRFAACEPAALCVVRALGQTEADMQARVPVLRQAEQAGRRQAQQASGAPWPHPALST